MIPKIIHYCWFGPKPLPKSAKRCINSWKKYFPDYEFMFWNETNSPLNGTFVRAAILAKKYAFVADYVRVWALHTYGGIYFDTDVLVVRPFTKIILEKEVLFAFEQPEKLYINVAVWGAKKESKFIAQILEVYQDLIFENDKIFDFAIPIIVTKVYDAYKDKENITLLDYDAFYPFPQSRRRIGDYKKYLTPNTYAVHLWDFSWLTWKERINIRVQRLFNSCKNIINAKSN